MAILSTFEPNLDKKLYKKAIDEFGKDNVVYVKKSKLFLLSTIVIPLIMISLIIIPIIIFLTNTIDTSSILYKILLGIICVFILIILNQFFMYFLTYYMDFILVTPTTFTKNKQYGLFKRSLDIVEIGHIKSVNAKKKGLFQSIFNIGALVMYSDGEFKPRESRGSRFRCVRNPELYCSKIEKLLRRY